MIRVFTFLIFFALPTVMGGSRNLNAQDPNPSVVPPLQPADTSSPAATLESLIDSCNELHQLLVAGAINDNRPEALLPAIERILDCLDLRDLPNELRQTAGIESALFLKEVLDRIPLPAADEIPNPDLSATENAGSFRWQIPGTRIAMVHVEAGPYRQGYLFTPGTVRRAPEFYRMVRELPYRQAGRVVSPGLRDAYIAATKRQPTQSADTSSPRGTLTLFIDSCNELYEAIRREKYFDRSDPEFQRLAEQIIACLDTSQLPEYTREYFDAEAAVCLKEVLDRIPLPPAEQIPGLESVESVDGGEPLGRWQVPRTQIAITRMVEGPRRGEYLFSAGTVARAPQLYNRVADQPYLTGAQYPLSEGFYRWWLSNPGHPTVAKLVDRLPDWFQTRFLAMSLWQLTGLVLVIPLCFGAMILLFERGRRRGEQVRESSLLRYWLSYGWFVAAALVPIAFKYFAWEYLTLRGNAVYVLNFCADLVFLMSTVGLIVGISTRTADSIVALPQIAPKSLDANLIRILCRVLGIIAAVIVFLEGGRYLGFPLTTLLASAGIGGLAVALSAQGLIKGLFGTVTILLDKPYRVGERIVVKGHDGFVEEIGLRSTKIRALTGNYISIPNDQMADSEIENIGKRRHIRRRTEIHIPIDTSRAKVAEAADCIREILSDHKGMSPDFPPRVFFTDFAPDAFVIQIVYWYSPPVYWEFMAFSEKINLEIFAAFEKRGIQFSLPLRHTYWKQDDRQGPLEIELKKSSRRGGDCEQELK